MQLATLDSTHEVDLIPGPPDSLAGEGFDEEEAAVAAADAAAIAATKASRREPAELDLDSGSFDDEDQEPLFGAVDEDFPRDPVGDDEDDQELADLDDLLRSGEGIQGELEE